MVDQAREEGASGGKEAEENKGQEERSAGQDLADGLAVKNVDSRRLEELGRRAMSSVENLDKKRVEELGRKAKERLDPRRIEEIAEDAGREIMKVIERIADRVETTVGSRRESERPPDADSQGNDEERPRVRVKDDDS
jgi:hypothetical protein